MNTNICSFEHYALRLCSQLSEAYDADILALRGVYNVIINKCVAGG